MQDLDVLDPKDLDPSFRNASKRRADAVLVLNVAGINFSANTDP